MDMIHFTNRFSFTISLLALALVSASTNIEAGHRGGWGGGGSGGGGNSTTWTKLYGTSAAEFGSDVAIDSAGNVLSSGYGNGLGTVAKHNASGTLLWLNQVGSGSEKFSGIITDANDSVFVTGNRNSSVAGNNLGNTDIIVFNYDSSGNLLFSFQTGTSGRDRGASIALDSSGNIYICGDTTGNLGGQITNTNGDAYLAKYDVTGALIWADQFGDAAGSGFDECHDVAVDANDNVYVTGDFSNHDYFAAKYDYQGTQSWFQRSNTPSAENAYGIAVDPNGNVFIGGNTGLTIDPNANPNTNLGSWDAFVIKFNNSGVLEWSRQFGSSNEDRAFAVAADANGNVYVTGIINRDITSLPASIFSAKFNSAGTQQFLRQRSGNGVEGHGITVNSAGTDFYITGVAYGNFNGQTSNGIQDVLVTRNRP